MAEILYRLASGAIQRRGLVVVAWLGVVFAAFGASAMWTGPTSDALRIPGAESQFANDLLSERFPEVAGSSAQLVFRAVDGGSILDPEVLVEIERVLSAAKDLPDVVGVLSPVEIDAVSADGTVGIGQVSYGVAASEVPLKSAEALLALSTDQPVDGVLVSVGGEVPAMVAPELGVTSELVGLVVALLVLLFTFGSLLAAGMPLLTGVLGVTITYSAIYLIANVVDLPSTTSTLALMIGLAVGIDYALFIVSRHREELAAGRSVNSAAAIATATAGGAVVFAGLSVIIAIAGLAVVGIPFLATMGFAAAGGVLVAVVMAITLTPALLSFCGRRVMPRRERTVARVDETKQGKTTLSVRWATAVLRRPVVALIGSVLVLGALSAPLLDLRLGFPDDRSLQEGSTRRVAFETIENAFGNGFNAPLTLAVDLRNITDKDAALAATVKYVADVPGVVVVLDPVVNEAKDTAIVAVVPTDGPAAEETEALLSTLRSMDDDLRKAGGASFYVTGLTATNIDTAKALGDALAPFLVLVLGLMLILLVLAFRSFVVAIKALVAILLSVAASFGVLVAVFQWGWLAGLIGVEAPLPLIPFLPIIMFAILFGLSMDYEVFILSRVRERISAGDTPAAATLDGLGRSAKVITAAAMIMIAVFGSFIAQVDPTIKMFGVGLAVAVLLDATIVRMVFVPAALALLDTRAWRLSPRLDRILPDLDIEGHRLTAMNNHTDTSTTDSTQRVV
jgi:RND superfamily putative drug exporter